MVSPRNNCGRWVSGSTTGAGLLVTPRLQPCLSAPFLVARGWGWAVAKGLHTHARIIQSSQSRVVSGEDHHVS